MTETAKKQGDDADIMRAFNAAQKVYAEILGCSYDEAIGQLTPRHHAALCAAIGAAAVQGFREGMNAARCHCMPAA